MPTTTLDLEGRRRRLRALPGRAGLDEILFRHGLKPVLGRGARRGLHLDCLVWRVLLTLRLLGLWLRLMVKLKLLELLLLRC